MFTKLLRNSVAPLGSKTSFRASNDLLPNVLKRIPIASQTFSKSHLQYPQGYAPLFLSHGKGAYVWDIDGNIFIDMINGLMSITLGYCDPDVDQAIQHQLSKGISFSMPTELEYELAKKLCSLIPCAEMVRFGKTGSDATAGAIRLARAYTGREKILVCGYHGWQDWYIGSTSRHLGVPQQVRDLTKSVAYNDLEQIQEHLKTEEYAAFIMEPINSTEPKPGFLEGVREATTQTGTVFIFDEICTGFHFALGGAQSYFGVTPDLSAFGKGMGNGMPISAVVGRADIMRKMDDIFFSGTFGGEALSLAACLAVIKKMERENVIAHLWSAGENLAQAVSHIIRDEDLENTISFKGMAPWKIMAVEPFEDISAQAIKTFIQKNMIAQGILILSTHNISYAFGEPEHDRVVEAYQKTFKALAEHLRKRTLMDNIGCPVIEPIFKVR